jgi:hypothetical protein
MANKHIARRRSVSVPTVENHLRSIFRKTGVDSRTKLALAAGVDGSYPLPGLDDCTDRRRPADRRRDREIAASLRAARPAAHRAGNGRHR